MEIKKFAAIDIGSNSIRLLIEHVMETDKEVMFKKNSLIRVPVRLGEDAFGEHKIPEKTVKRLVDAMHGFRYLMKVNDVLHYKGGATSAMREAKNGDAIVKRIEKETGVKIQVISGSNEARMIFASQQIFASKLKDNCLFVDVGGGSTEITVFSKGEVVTAKSFDIGTLRILNDLVTKDAWKEMRDWLKKSIGKFPHFSVVGSGGNINRIAKLAQLKQGKAMPVETLAEIIAQIKPYSLEDRMKIFDLNPDRADVIVPAGDIFLTIMKLCGATKIFIPKIGLSDGMVREVYAEYKLGMRSTFE
ncbi:MAG: ethanolamine ammonia-lyase reactivating factor EutA [Chitinophagales bacterium]|nr:ethanolamine ammonia-lyase reactivating factor EutA [Chitinophagales bacterium]